MHLNGYPLTLMVFALIAGGFCLKWGKGARVISACAAAAALFAVLAIPPWMDALASVFATGPGMVILVIVSIVSGAVFVLDHLKHHHPVRTTAFGIVAATTGVMAWAMAPQLGAQGSKLGPQTAAALGQAQQQIASGHAASAIPPSTALMYLAIGAAVVVALVRYVNRHNQRRPFAKAQPFGGGRAAALPAGQGGQGGKKPGFIARVTGRA